MFSLDEQRWILNRFRKIPYITVLVPNLLAGFIVFIYFWYLDIHTTLYRIKDYPLGSFYFAVSTILVLYCICITIIGIRFYGTYDKLKKHLSGDLGEKETHDLKKNVLNINFFTISVTFLGWTANGIIIPGYFILIGYPAEVMLRNAFINIFIGGTITAAISFFLNDTYMKKMIPSIFPDGDFTNLNGIRNIRINHKIAAALWMSGILPVISLYFISHHYIEIMDGGMDGILVRQQFDALTVIVAVMGTIMSVISFFYFIRNIGQPLSRLKKVMKDIGKGNLGIKLPVMHTDEIGVLYQGINGMITDLKKSIEDREKLLLLDQEMSIAMQVQQSVLTGPEKSGDNGHFEFDIMYLPKNKKVGGDYYNITLLEDGTVSFMIADATGHGMQAALATMQIDNLNRQCLELIAPDRRLTYVNSVYINKISGKNIFSAFILNARDDSIYYSSAAHPAQLILRKNGGYGELKAKGRLIGLLQDTGFECLSGTLEEGDIIVLFTDGAYEEFNGKGEIFGIERFRTVLIEASVEFRDGPLRNINMRVKSAIEDFLSGEPWFDDMTVILARKK